MALLSSYNPHELPEATVRAVATGRDHPLHEVLSVVRSNLDAPTMQHLIVSAPRGYGKSFMMRHLELEVARIAREDGLPLAAVLMPEEMPHVKEPETLIRELTRALTGGAGDEAELSWHEDDGAAWEAAVAALSAAVRERLGERGLLVALVENFDILLRRAFPKEDQVSLLRGLLAEPGGRVMLVAASAGGAFDRDYDRRLFQAFHEIQLKPWTDEECLTFFDRQRIAAGKSPLDDRARARARAVARFIGGTPRLATLLGEALFEDDLLRAADLLRRLVDELTPYYKERIEALPGRSQKLLDALLRFGEPAGPSEIARRVKARGQSAIAGPFQDLVRERVVVGDKAPGSAEMLYRVADRVFAHYYRRRIITHGEGGCPLEGLVELLTEFFTPDEKRAKAEEFARRGLIDEARVMARLHNADRGVSEESKRGFLRELAENVIPQLSMLATDESTKEALRDIAGFARSSDVDCAYARQRRALDAASLPGDRVLLQLTRASLDAYEGIEAGLTAADEAASLATPLADRRFAELAIHCRVWCLTNLQRYQEALLESHKASSGGVISSLRGKRAISLFQARCLFGLGRFEEAITSAIQFAKAAENADNQIMRVAALFVAASSLQRLERHDDAVATAFQAAEIAEKEGDSEGQANSLQIAAVSLAQSGRQEEAVSTALQAAEIAEKVGKRTVRIAAFYAAASSLAQLERHEEAISIALQAINLAEQAGDRILRTASLLIAASSFRALGQLQKSIAFFSSAIELALDLGEKKLLTFAKGNLARVLAESGDFANSMRILSELYQSPRGYFFENSVTGRLSLALSLANIIVHLVVDVDSPRFHAFLNVAGEYLDFPDSRGEGLNIFLHQVASQMVRQCEEPDKLDLWAGAVELRFPDGFQNETSLLRNTARYHREGRSREVLARLDPDVANALSTMFPPNAEPEKPKRARKRSLPKQG